MEKVAHLNFASHSALFLNLKQSWSYAECTLYIFKKFHEVVLNKLTCQIHAESQHAHLGLLLKYYYTGQYSFKPFILLIQIFR